MVLRVTRSLSFSGIETFLRLRSLTYFTFFLDERLWGARIFGYHLTNLLLHSLASALAAWASYCLTSRQRTSLLCGLLFAVHPIHVEAVASVANRKDVLAMIFVSLSVIFLLTRRNSVMASLASLACFGCAVLSKEVAALGLVFMLPIAGFLKTGPHPPRYNRREVGLRLLPVVLLGLAVVALHWSDVTNAFRPDRIALQTDGLFDSWSGVLTGSLAAIPRTVGLLILPIRLSADYPVSGTHGWEPASTLGLVLVVLWTAGSLILLRSRPLYGFALLWTLVMYLPCSNVVPLSTYFVADRYLYVPSFGVCLLLAAVFGRYIEKGNQSGWGSRMSVLSLVAAILLGGAVRSMFRVRDWKDDLSLWSSAARTVSGGTCRIHLFLGSMLAQQGSFDKAIPHLETAIRLAPQNPDPAYNLGLALYESGRPRDAIPRLQFAASRTADDIGPFLYLGLCHMRAGELDSAAVLFGRVLRMNSECGVAQLYLGAVLVDLGRVSEGSEWLSRTDGGNSPSRSFLMGGTLAASGKPLEAESEYRHALAMDSNFMPAVLSLAWQLATSPSVEQRNGPEALRLAEQAISFAGSTDPRVLMVLAAAQAETGSFQTAKHNAAMANYIAGKRARGDLSSECHKMEEVFRRGHTMRTSAPVFKVTDLLFPWN